MEILTPYNLNYDVIVSLTDKGIELYNKYCQGLGYKDASMNKVNPDSFFVRSSTGVCENKFDNYYQMALREVFYIFDNKELQMHDYVKFNILLCKY